MFLAVDGGARAALQPLASQTGDLLMDVERDAAETQAFWVHVRACAKPDLLVVGTSDSARGRRVEAAARQVFRAAHLPIAAIEDFPGNYVCVPDGRADLVIVESDRVREMHLAGKQCCGERFEAFPPARFDPYRAKRGQRCAATWERWTTARAQDCARTLLWAGQPETEDSLHTMRVLMPAAHKLKAKILFRAHPRDPGYGRGDYHALYRAEGASIHDCTAMSAADALNQGPDLVVTQFSSLAIEGGFFGIPSLHVLLPESGGARLREKKGYAVPPLCLAGGAAWVTQEARVGIALGEALNNERRRQALITDFNAYFEVHTLAAEKVVRRLDELAAGGN